MDDLMVSERAEVPWIGKIPDGWSVKRLKHIFSEKKSTKNPTLSSGSISFGTVIFKDDESIPESTKESYQEVLEGEFLINPLNLNYDLKSLRIGLSRINVVVSQGYIVLKLKDGFYPQYYEYLMRKFDVEHMKSLGQGVRQTISFTHIKDEELVVPPVEEQKLISRYLDKKTEQIDRLVEKIQKKIELLKEQRTSLINQSVTKGLDTNVEMKDSGVEWIGEVPKHWSLSKLKYEGEFISGHSFDSDAFTENGEIRAVKISNIQNNGMVWEDLSFLPIEYWNQFREFRILKGDLLFVLTRPIISSGIKVTFYNEEYKSLLNQRNSIFRATETSLVKDYLFFVVRTQFFLNEFKSQLKETGQPNISTGQISNIRICIPPVSEQSKISQILSKKNNDFELLIKHEQTKIDLLKEYRQSLISSAVTGKVRVTEDMI